MTQEERIGKLQDAVEALKAHLEKMNSCHAKADGKFCSRGGGGGGKGKATPGSIRIGPGAKLMTTSQAKAAANKLLKDQGHGKVVSVSRGPDVPMSSGLKPSFHAKMESGQVIRLVQTWGGLEAV